MSDTSQLDSKRFKMTLIGFFGTLACAILKHFLAGLSTELVFLAGTLIAGYCGFESFRPSLPTSGKSNG